MHALTDAIEQQSDAIRARLKESSERLADHIERTTRDFIVRMALLISVATATLFILYTLA